MNSGLQNGKRPSTPWEVNHCKLSKFISEERNLCSWWKHNKKLMNAGELKPERVGMFKLLLELGWKYKHVNQYA